MRLLAIKHQTTTVEDELADMSEMRLLAIKHQTTTVPPKVKTFSLMRLLAIKHQTTTVQDRAGFNNECVYWRLNIKPQQER